MERAIEVAKKWVRRIWHGLREWCGDAAYERYVDVHAKSGEKQPLSAKDFYIEQLNRRYSRPNRCC